MEPNGDWRGGFLFVGNRLSLDFVNTRPVIDGVPAEFLPDEDSVLRWSKAAGIAPEELAEWPSCSPADLEALIAFREAWRQVLLGIEAGKPPSARFVATVNSLLAAHPLYDRVIPEGAGLARRRVFQPVRPTDVLGPILDDAADLITVTDLSRLRKCANCVLHFYDISKKGSRRWCSMNICGNRFKVANYARRLRAKHTETPSGAK
jgi:predicted RNA-binding Zn ribbon-like protein